jgi:hypothetical protein
VVVELVKQHEKWFNSPHPFFLVVMGLNPLAVVVCEPNATKKGITNLYFSGVFVMGSLSKAVVIAQTEPTCILVGLL